MENFDRMLKKRDTLIFIDFEGTQFSHEIIAAGCVRTRSESGFPTGEPHFFKRYVKCYGRIGKIVTEMTAIDENVLKDQGIPMETFLSDLHEFIGENISRCAFIAFGSNDMKMMLDSIRQSRPANEKIGYEICKNTIDFQSFLSQYIRDEKGNPYSLVNYLKVFGKEPCGKMHDPLNDAIDLMNLYRCFFTDKEQVVREYTKVLARMKILPPPVQNVVRQLIQGRTVAPEDFYDEIRKYFG